MSKRYETLVVRGSASQTVPREAAGGEVVAWAAGHSLAELGTLETFVQELADGFYEDESIGDLQAKAERVLDLASRRRDQGWTKEQDQ